MNKVSLLLALLTIPFLVNGQTTSENYVKSTTYQNGYQWTDIVNDQVLTDDKIETIQYFDGLGRTTQTIAQRAGGNREDLVTPTYYDTLGRTPKSYLPLAVIDHDGSWYVPQGTQSIQQELVTFYKGKFPEDFHQGVGLYPEEYDNPYAHQNYEKSPLNRVLEQGAPGKDWHINSSSDYDHTIKYQYATNTLSDAVIEFAVSFNQGDYRAPVLQYAGTFLANKLFKNVVKDENWQPGDGSNHTVEQYTNQRGQMILKRHFNNAEILDTYYVYDNAGNLSFVISPEGADQIVNNGNIVASILDKFCYQYKYDDRGRVFEKKVPGKEKESIVYDLLDRPILVQDENLRLDGNKWLFTKYDKFNRVAYTGILSGYTKAQVEIAKNTQGLQLSENQQEAHLILGTTVHYSNNAFPQTDIEVHTINYYDEYVYTSVPTTNTYGQSITNNTKGLVTSTWVRVLEGLPSSQHWITTTTGFDEQGRPIYILASNPYLGSTDTVNTSLDFTGKPYEETTVHSMSGINSNTITTVDYYGYDHMGRMLAHAQQVDDEPVQLITRNYYDELGQLVKKDVGGETFVDGYTGIENVDISPEEVMVKSVSTNAWDAGVKTRGEIISDGGVRFKIKQSNKYIRVGLKKPNSGLGGDGWDIYDYAISAHDDGKLFLVINGTEGTQVATYSADDSFSIERVGTTVSFKKNGTNLITPITDSSGIAMVGKASFFTGSGSIEELELFGTNIDKVLQEVDYKYNVRGWMTHINDPGASGLFLDNDLFKFKINYNKAIEGTANNGGAVTSLYNGNIAQTIWKTANDNGTKHTYGYKYDPLNRLTGAYSRRGANLDIVDFHDLESVTYDKNGNIMGLLRKGTNVDGNMTGAWDDLSYSYDGNQLEGVVENSIHPTLKDEGFFDGNLTTVDYVYDDNGNLTSDTNKGINSILYNYLNLPKQLNISNSEGTGTITYIYDALGIKLERIAIINGQTDVTKYAGNYVYLDDELQFFNHPEGYISYVEGTSGSVRGFDQGETTQSSYHYVFQYRDHLGNIRLSYSGSDKNGSVNASEIIEESNYYPFGLKHKGYNNTIALNQGNSLAQQWKFGGKELNDELSLGWYDVTARNYDPAIGRWMNIDPLADAMRRHSPYNYAFDNPVFFIDADGLSPTGFQGVIDDMKKKYGGGEENNPLIPENDSGLWSHEGEGEYRNNSTGELTNDGNRAVGETMSATGDKGNALLSDMMLFVLKTAAYDAEKDFIKEKGWKKQVNDGTTFRDVEKNNQMFKKPFVELNKSYAEAPPKITKENFSNYSGRNVEWRDSNQSIGGIDVDVFYSGGGLVFQHMTDLHKGDVNFFQGGVDVYRIDFTWDRNGRNVAGSLIFESKKDYVLWREFYNNYYKGMQYVVKDSYGNGVNAKYKGF